MWDQPTGALEGKGWRPVQEAQPFLFRMATCTSMVSQEGCLYSHCPREGSLCQHGSQGGCLRQRGPQVGCQNSTGPKKAVHGSSMDLTKIPVGLHTNMVPMKAFHTRMGPRKAYISIALRKAFSTATAPAPPPLPRQGSGNQLPFLCTVPYER